MVAKLRILVVDGSQLMGWLVDSLTPPSVTVTQVASFEEARWLLNNYPPDAAVFNITPSELPWHELRDQCRVHEPAIPFLCFSTVDNDATEADGCQDDRVVLKPMPNNELRTRIRRLINEAQGWATDSRSDAECFVPTPRPSMQGGDP